MSIKILFRADSYLDSAADEGAYRMRMGHPDWHPLALAHRSPLTLVMDDGRKLKLLLKNLQGSVEASGDFF